MDGPGITLEIRIPAGVPYRIFGFGGSEHNTPEKKLP